jgi:hypothetical protein
MIKYIWDVILCLRKFAYVLIPMGALIDVDIVGLDINLIKSLKKKK